MIDGALPEQILEKRNLRQTGNSGEVLGLRILKHSAHQVGFTFAESDYVFNLSLSNNRLRNATNICAAGDG